MDAQVENAVQIAYNPGADPQIKRQAMTFLEQVKQSSDAWQVCLPLFARDPKPTEIVRHFCLDVLNIAVQRRFHQTDDQSLNYIRETLMDYIRRSYFTGSGAPDSPGIQNKLTQTLTSLFVSMYTTTWGSFFDDMLTLTSSSSEANARGNRDNYLGVVFFLRIVASVHEEVADVLVPHTMEEAQRNTQIKDVARERDVRKLVVAWQEILAQWNGSDKGIVEMCLRVVGRWVSWIDISLVVNEVLLGMLYNFILGESRVRDAAIVTLADIVGKRMKGTDKLELIVFLKLGEIVETLVNSPALQAHGQPTYDLELAEGVARLVNNVTTDILRILNDDSLDIQVKQRAEELFQPFFPFLLRFFSDEWDEVSHAVYPSMLDLLSLLRKEKRVTGILSHAHSLMLSPILNAIVLKAKYDEDSVWGGEDDDEADEAEFQALRKRLKTLQDTVAAIDEQLYINTLSSLIGTTFDRVAEGGVAAADWREVDLAMYEMFLFGELAMRSGGMFNKGQPQGLAAEALISLMIKMMNSGIVASSHPAIKLRYMETVVRYAAFFEVHTTYIPKALENFVGGVHDSHVRVRNRSWYLFFRFVKTLRQHIGGVAQEVLEAISDILVIKAELPQDAGDNEMSSDDAQGEDTTFESQLHLFEAVGCLSSIKSVALEKQVLFVTTVMTPLFRNMESTLEAAKQGDARCVLQVHHIMMALGILAKGYADGTPGPGVSASAPNELVVREFENASEVILVSLESLRNCPNVRDAARRSFSKMVVILGPRALPTLPRWLEGLLAEDSTAEEILVFLRLLKQIVHGFKSEFYDILNSLLTPLLNKVFSSLGQEATGTDDEIQAAELRKEYLDFLLVILNNDLGLVLVSEANQPIFEQLIGTVQHFAKEVNDLPTSKLAFSVMGKMSIVWGPATDSAKERTNGNLKEQPLPGFDTFMIKRFSSLCWEVPAMPGFRPKDAQAKMVLAEIAALQNILYTKLGENFIQYLGTVYFPSVNLPQGPAEEYLVALRQMGFKPFRSYFQVDIQCKCDSGN
ncbi:armadillo-type protein [Tuber indicum]|nr:armadillo-type protein [Tuber indicum]